ncbi:hypothetical protein KEM55_002356 [Ascosphaera atra]|nr:hypothetical protein KEM55_002356 [Ascosphaera atra]
MHAILKPFLLRRVKTDVETSLPKKREYILYAPLTPEQKDLYLEIINGTSRNYLERKAVERIEKRNKRPETRAQKLKRTASESGASTPTGSMSPRSGSATPRSGKRQKMSYREMSDREFNKRCHMLDRGEDVSLMDEWEEEEPSESGLIEIERAKTMALAKKEISTKKLQNPIMQARLACNSPHNFYWPWTPQPHEPDGAYRVDHTLVTSSGKMLLLDRLVPRLMSKGHKLLIFSQFKTQLDILQDWAQQLHGWNVCRIDGGVSQSERRALIAAFNKDPSYKLFLLSTRAGGQGINLTAADTVILFDSDWNPQQDLQPPRFNQNK